MNAKISQIRSKTPGPVSIEVGDFSKEAPLPAVVVKINGAENSGALTHEAGLGLAQAAKMALEKKYPLVAFISSVGADISEGVSAVYGWGIAARQMVECSGRIPLIFATCGPAVSGPALLLGISDISIMTVDSYAFVSGPTMVKQFTGVGISKEELGGFDSHDSKSGVADFIVQDMDAAENLVAELLTLLPPNTDTLPEQLDTNDPPEKELPTAAGIIPKNRQGSYDVRDILKLVVDNGDLLESKPKWAANIITAFATVDGHPIGIIANQPQVLAGTLDIAASQKAAHFVNFLDSFNLPILTFVDTPGFQPGKDLEWRGMIRHGAQLAFAYARATVPRICITLRKSYGGAYIVMDSKKMGNDLAFAWPSAEIAVMGSKGASEILHRNLNPEARQTEEDLYAERHLNPYKAAEIGSVDAVIDPKDTRLHISRSLEILRGKKEALPARRHDNTPL